MPCNPFIEILSRSNIVATIKFRLDYVDVICHDIKKACHVGKNATGFIKKVAGATRIELATSGVTGRRSNQSELRPRNTLSIQFYFPDLPSDLPAVSSGTF
jgi:hypothetical protein